MRGQVEGRGRRAARHPGGPRSSATGVGGARPLSAAASRTLHPRLGSSAAPDRLGSPGLRPPDRESPVHVSQDWTRNSPKLVLHYRNDKAAGPQGDVTFLSGRLYLLTGGPASESARVLPWLWGPVDSTASAGPERISRLEEGPLSGQLCPELWVPFLRRLPPTGHPLPTSKAGAAAPCTG